MEIFKDKSFHKIHKRIFISKPAFDIEKEEILRNSSAFILSSFSEGLPMAVLEAMSYEMPCLISDNCNLPDVLKIGAAIKTNPTTNEIFDALKILFKMSDEEKRKMTLKALKYIIENHSWEKLTYEIKNHYDSICKDF